MKAGPFSAADQAQPQIAPIVPLIETKHVRIWVEHLEHLRVHLLDFTPVPITDL
jgi:hypothetical protein